jgi:hypothetical protein
MISEVKDGLRRKESLPLDMYAEVVERQERHQQLYGVGIREWMYEEAPVLRGIQKHEMWMGGRGAYLVVLAHVGHELEVYVWLEVREGDDE